MPGWFAKDTLANKRSICSTYVYLTNTHATMHPVISMCLFLRRSIIPNAACMVRLLKRIAGKHTLLHNAADAALTDI
jgi:hypothetical protein